MRICFSRAIPFFLVGIVIFIYILTKAAISSFTYDESYTYLRYVHTSFMDILAYKGWYSNNHLLNTLFMKYSELLFGSSELALRLPNLLLFCVYMTYSYLLFRRTSPILAIAVFILLCTNNSLVDLFGLARGYGMSCGFMLMGLFHFIQSFYSQKTKNILLFHAGSLLAVLSSFPLLTFYVALMLIYNVMIFIDCKFFSNERCHFLSSNKIHAIPLLFSLIILYEPVRRVIMANDLDFGGKNGFFADTVTHLIYTSLHYIYLSPFALAGMQVLFTGIVLISFAIILRMTISRNELFFRKYKGLIITNLLLIFISVAIILQHFILGSDYPVSRFSVFLYPIFMIHFGFLLSYFNTNYKRVVPIVALSLALVSATSFGLKADLYTCSEWAYNRDTKEMIQKLAEYHQKNDSGSGKIKLGINWLFDSTINFYIQTMKIDWLLPVDRSALTKEDDYYYIFKDQLNELNPEDYEVIFEFNKTNTLLLKNSKSHSSR